MQQNFNDLILTFMTVVFLKLAFFSLLVDSREETLVCKNFDFGSMQKFNQTLNQSNASLPMCEILGNAFSFFNDSSIIESEQPNKVLLLVTDRFAWSPSSQIDRENESFLFYILCLEMAKILFRFLRHQIVLMKNSLVKTLGRVAKLRKTQIILLICHIFFRSKRFNACVKRLVQDLNQNTTQIGGDQFRPDFQPDVWIFEQFGFLHVDQDDFIGVESQDEPRDTDQPEIYLI